MRLSNRQNTTFGERLCLPVVTLLVFALLFSVAGASFASKADELLDDAAKAVSKAESAKQSADRDESFKKAMQLYNQVVAKFSDTPQAVKALYEIAAANRQMSERFKAAKEKQKYLRPAYDSLTRLVNNYDKPESSFSTLTSTEVHEVQREVAKAKILRAQMAEELSKINSHDWKYKVIDKLVGLTGRVPGFSYWFAIILITLVVKLLITPLTHAQFKAMKEMQKVTPLIKDIQAKYKGDQKTIGEKTMEIYKQHKINPFASCLPLIIQMPIMLLLFQAISSYEFQFAKGTFLWIGSGLAHLYSLPVPFNPGKVVWFTARNLTEPDLILLVLYIISMYVSTKLSAVDPTQAEQQKTMAIMMPFMFAFILAGFPSALLLYWLVFNILQTTQQYFVLRSGRAEAITPSGPAGPEPQQGQGETSRARRRRRR